MEMVGHYAEAEQVYLKLGFRGGEQVKKGAIVTIVVKQSRAAIAPVEDMVGKAAVLSTGRAGHLLMRQPGGSKS